MYQIQKGSILMVQNPKKFNFDGLNPKKVQFYRFKSLKIFLNIQCWAGSVIPGSGSAILRRSQSRDQGSVIPFFNFRDRIVFWKGKRSRSWDWDRGSTILILILGIGIVFRKISDPDPATRIKTILIHFLSGIVFKDF
jgi:hypothetical protein